MIRQVKDAPRPAVVALITEAVKAGTTVGVIEAIVGPDTVKALANATLTPLVTPLVTTALCGPLMAVGPVAIPHEMEVVVMVPGVQTTPPSGLPPAVNATVEPASKPVPERINVVAVPEVPFQINVGVAETELTTGAATMAISAPVLVPPLVPAAFVTVKPAVPNAAPAATATSTTRFVVPEDDTEVKVSDGLVEVTTSVAARPVPDSVSGNARAPTPMDVGVPGVVTVIEPPTVK